MYDLIIIGADSAVRRLAFPAYKKPRPYIALIGEAAGWISPSSAEGLSYAFRSALSLALSLRGSKENYLKRYVESAGNLKYNITVKNLKSVFMYNDFLRRLIIRSGFKSVYALNSEVLSNVEA